MGGVVIGRGSKALYGWVGTCIIDQVLQFYVPPIIDQLPMLGCAKMKSCGYNLTGTNGVLQSSTILRAFISFECKTGC